MAFIDEIEALALELREMGYEVHTPDREGTAFNWDELGEEQRFSRKREYIDAYLDAIKRSDLVLIANYAKDGVAGYIGANSLMEAAFAYALHIPVAYLYDVGPQSCQLEALAISGRIIAGDLHSLDSMFL